jgi:hypothetical protein
MPIRFTGACLINFSMNCPVINFPKVTLIEIKLGKFGVRNNADLDTF